MRSLLPETIGKIQVMVLVELRLKLLENVEATDISHGAVVSILHDHGMRKLSTRWVPGLFTMDHQPNRVTTSKRCLRLFHCNPDEFDAVS